MCAMLEVLPLLSCRDYYQAKLSLEWREWMTNKLTSDYFKDRTFYQAGGSGVLGGWADGWVGGADRWMTNKLTSDYFQDSTLLPGDGGVWVGWVLGGTGGWMTNKLTSDHLLWLQVQAGALVDNPDQRIAVDVR